MNAFSKATLIATLLAGSLAFAGEGRNGPDRAGVSIPTKVDRLIDLEVFQEVEKSCELKQSYLVISQILRRNLTAAELKNFRPSGSWVPDSTPANSAGLSATTLIISNASTHDEQFEGVIKAFPGQIDLEKLPDLALAVAVRSHYYPNYAVSDETYKALESNASRFRALIMPLSAAPVIASQPSYDEFGAPLSKVITGYTINADSRVILKETIYLVSDGKGGFSPATGDSLYIPGGQLTTQFQTYVDGFRQCLAEGLK